MSDFHILLIDDEPNQITSIQSFLKRRDYKVYSANSGDEGLKILKENSIDLVFSDFRMPDMSGLDVVKAVKQFNPETPVVVVTAFSDTKDAVQVMKEGAFDYLSKPVDLDELEILVKKAKEHTHLVSENKSLRTVM